jgi:hypothetical protein
VRGVGKNDSRLSAMTFFAFTAYSLISSSGESRDTGEDRSTQGSVDAEAAGVGLTPGKREVAVECLALYNACVWMSRAISA